MLEVLENLLILQDRDRRILSTRGELAEVEPQRRLLQSKIAHAQTHLEAAKHRGKQLETERKELELEVETKKQQIDRYSVQQFQTKRNEEYRALTHQIDMCKEAIVKLEDQELEFMEQADAVQKAAVEAGHTLAQLKRDIADQLSQLAEREQNLVQQLAELEADRNKLAAAVEERALSRYERLLQRKGENAIVGIVNGVCGGCHMKLPVQIVVTCQGDSDIVNCLNCGRILYFSREMNVAVSE